MTEAYTNHLCLRCSKLQKTCCNDSPSVPFTVGDIERLTALGHKFEDFAIAGEYEEEDFRGEEPWWEAGMIEIGGKFYKVNVRKKADGSCHFLDAEKGCTLGKDRPAVCKIYPYWMDDRGSFVYEDGEREYCLIGKEKNSITDGMRLIGETEHNIRQYFDEIKKDCLDNHKQHRGLLLRLLKQPA